MIRSLGWRAIFIAEILAGFGGWQRAWRAAWSASILACSRQRSHRSAVSNNRVSAERVLATVWTSFWRSNTSASAESDRTREAAAIKSLRWQSDGVNRY